MTPRVSVRDTSGMLLGRSYKHCKSCGAAVVYAVPPDDNRERATCTACGTVFYENPINVVGTVPAWGDQVLLCRRNIEPRFGFWTLPAGFMEFGESAGEGAARETDEEAGANFELGDLFTVLSVPRVGQVHLYFHARLTDTVFAPGPETTEARLFTEAEVPWDELAFRTVRETLEHYFTDRRAGRFRVHTGTLD